LIKKILIIIIATQPKGIKIKIIGFLAKKLTINNTDIKIEIKKGK